MTTNKTGVIKKIKALINKEDVPTKDKLNNGKTIYKKKNPVVLPTSDIPLEEITTENEDGIPSKELFPKAILEVEKDALMEIREDVDTLEVRQYNYVKSETSKTEKKYVSEKVVTPGKYFGLKKPLVEKRGPYPTDVNYVYFHTPFLNILTIKNGVEEDVNIKDNTVFRTIKRQYNPQFD